MVVRNDRKTELLIGAFPYFNAGVESRTAGSKEWVRLSTSSWYDDGSFKYAQCDQVFRGGSYRVGRVETSIVTF